jgi:hypothetical protein
MKTAHREAAKAKRQIWDQAFERIDAVNDVELVDLGLMTNDDYERGIIDRIDIGSGDSWA